MPSTAGTKATRAGTSYRAQDDEVATTIRLRNPDLRLSIGVLANLVTSFVRRRLVTHTVTAAASGLVAEAVRGERAAALTGGLCVGRRQRSIHTLLARPTNGATAAAEASTPGAPVEQPTKPDMNYRWTPTGGSRFLCRPTQ